MYSGHPYGAELNEIREAARWRFLRAWQGSGGVFRHEGKTWHNFSSNDYLDLSGHPALATAVSEMVASHGCGSTASRLMSGNLTVHEDLEGALAQLTGMDSALIFPSGYQANVGVMTSLAGAGDAIFSDALNHASIIDGARLSRAQIHVYRHRDTAHLEELLVAFAGKGRKIIVTDAVFSMDGDIAPMERLAALARRHDAILAVDEAHAIGIWGRGGGICQHLGVRPDVIIGTLGKSLGSGGGFVACDRGYRDLFVNRARSFIYSTGVSPMNAAAALAAIGEVERTGSLGDELLRRSHVFQGMLRAAGVPIMAGETQIIPIMVGDNARVTALAETLLDEGLIATGIRPPTVPEGTSRLRLSVTLAHDEETLQQAAIGLARVLAV